MKVIDKMQNSLNQEFEYCSESQMIEVMNMRKASDSIWIRREFHSNEMDESDSHDRKHDEPGDEIPRGIVI
jgi:hypothetical protein